jgi:hypothetical protein
VKLKPAEQYEFKLTRLGRKWWLTVNDVALFDQVDTPRLPALGFGLLTWDANARFESVKLNRLALR